MKNVIAVVKKIFSHPGYILLAIFFALALLLAAIWLPNFSFVWQTIFVSGLGLQQKISILFISLLAFETNFTPLSRAVTIALAVLFGINAALLIFYINNRFRLEREAGLGVGGTIFGLLGVGCASCGPVILSSFLGASAAASFVNILPLKGEEFGFIGIALMIISIWLTAKKIKQPLSCKIY